MKLPFVVEPKVVETVPVGNEAIGILEIPKLKDIAPVERRFLKSLNLIDIRKEAVKLAAVIATKEDKRLVEIYNALVTSNVEMLGEYLAEIIAFEELTKEAAEERTIALATAVLRYRLMRQEDWTIEHTLNQDLIRPELVKEIALFAEKEESGWIEAVPTEPLTDEALGNS